MHLRFTLICNGGGTGKSLHSIDRNSYQMDYPQMPWIQCTDYRIGIRYHRYRRDYTSITIIDSGPSDPE